MRALHLAAFAIALLGAAVALAQEPPAETQPVISLSVKEMAIQEVLKIAAEKGDFNVAIGPGVRGTVTLFVEDMPVARVLELAVNMVGAAFEIEDDVIQVMTREEYEAHYGRPYRDLRQSRTFRVQHVPVQDVAAVLAPFRSQTGQIVQDVRSNSVVVNEVPHRMEQMDSVIRSIDRPLETLAIPVTVTTPTDMAARLKGYLPATALVEPDPGGQRVLVTASSAVAERATAIVGLLDRAEPLETRTFTLDYAHPESTIALLADYTTPEVSIVRMDGRTRQLSVTDFPSRLDAIGGVLGELDLRTPEVLIEAKIIQVSLDDEIKTGIDWEVIERSLNVTGRFPILATEPLEDGLRVLSAQAGDYSVAFEALQTFGSTDILSSPRILVANGESARILVGTKVPYITTDTREDANGVQTRFERVTIVDTGVELNVDVVIHRDRMIEMTVEPRVSSVVSFVSEIPVVETSESSSRILVQDNTTVILGGLNRTETRESTVGVPLLSKIPLLGRIFSSKTSKDVQTELAIFLTPRIVTGGENVEAESALRGGGGD